MFTYLITRRAILALAKLCRVIRLQTGASFKNSEVGHLGDFGCSKWSFEEHLTIRFVSSIFSYEDIDVFIQFELYNTPSY